MKKGAIIIGGHVQGLGIVRILGELNYKIVVLDTTKFNIARHSKYTKEFIKYKKEELINKLLQLSEIKEYREFVLFPTNDHHVEVLSKNKKMLSKYFFVASDDWEVVQKCYNKRITYNIASKIDIHIPETYMPNSIEDLENINIKFPCIIKPAVMHSFYSKFQTKVFKCNNKNELYFYYKKAISVIPPEEIIIQSIIKTKSDGYYSACFLYNRNNDIEYLIGRRSRQHPPDFGNATTFAQIIDNEKIYNLAKRILNAVNYKGLCEVEFMYDTEKEDFCFLEINPRTWKWHTIAKKANVKFIENYINVLTSKPVKVNNNILKASFKHLLTDIPTIFKYKKRKIFKKYKKYPTQYAVYDIKDIKPFIFELLYLPILIYRR